jgi:putative serine protease PepD
LGCLLAIPVLLIAGLVGGLIANAISGSSGTSGASGTDDSSCNISQIAENELPSIVTIAAGNGQSGGTGSGEVIRSNGYIITNNHVISPAAGGGSLQVTFQDGSTARATITGQDPLTDLAVIHVNKSGLRTIPIGNSKNLRIGQPAIVLGSPLGLSSTVTAGIVSALNRTIQVPGESSQASAFLIDAIQTDAAVNPGNSGGALVNCSGRLVGIPSAGASVPSPSGESAGGSIGLNFAIPVNLATKVADEIISTGRVTHAYIGIQAQAVSANAALQQGRAEGILVTGLVQGGPAANAGLQPGDIITSIDGNRAVSTDQIVAVLLSRRAGDRVDVDFERDGAHKTTTVTLASPPSS